MTQAETLLAEAHRWGVSVEVAGERLFVHAETGIPPGLKQRLAERRGEVMHLLRRDQQQHEPKLARPVAGAEPHLLPGWSRGVVAVTLRRARSLNREGAATLRRAYHEGMKTTWYDPRLALPEREMVAWRAVEAASTRIDW